jgi:hypothetical protein
VLLAPTYLLLPHEVAMPLPALSPEDVDQLAKLPDRVREIITRDLEQKDHLRLQRERDAAARARDEASRQANPIVRAIAEENARRAAQPPRPRPAPAPAGMTALDARSYANSPAAQHIAALNAADVAAVQAKQAAESLARVERQEARDRAIAAREQGERERAANVAHARQLERAILAMAEAFVLKHPNV